MSRIFLNFFSISWIFQILSKRRELTVQPDPKTGNPDKGGGLDQTLPKPPLIRSHILLSHSLQLYHTLAVSPIGNISTGRTRIAR